jgi:hypothetical protein
MRWLAMLLALGACQREARMDDARSEGKALASLPATSQVRVWDAAVREAFDVGPGLVLLLSPTHLPRGAGYDGGTPVPDSLRAALVATGVVSGTCSPARESAQRAPRCDADRSGYVVRGSEIFRGAGDTLQLYLASEVYAAVNGPGQQPFTFEMAYKLVPRDGDRWQVVAEGRVRGSKQ